MDVRVLDVPADPRGCPFCAQPITGHAAVAFLPDGAIRWAHAVCAVSANGGVSAMRPRLAPAPEAVCA